MAVDGHNGRRRSGMQEAIRAGIVYVDPESGRVVTEQPLPIVVVEPAPAIFEGFVKLTSALVDGQVAPDEYDARLGELERLCGAREEDDAREPGGQA
jgi:hypothetical protein